MSPEGLNYIHTGANGVLKHPDEAGLRHMCTALAEADKVVLYFHGGLVDHDAGMEICRKLDPEFRKAEAIPVFFVWESGFFETVKNNLGEIAKEEIFSGLVKKLVSFVVGKLTTIGGGRDLGGPDLPNETELAIELKKASAGEEPYRGLESVADLRELTKSELEAFEKVLTEDPALQEEIQAVVDSTDPAGIDGRSTSRGITALDRGSTRTLMSPEILARLREDAKEKEDRGILASAAFIRAAASVLARVIRRFVKRRDHGVYATVVEEVLREFYVANVGAAIWQAMKQETADTFENGSGGPKRGGWLFVREFGQALSERAAAPSVSLVCHSAGAIFVCNLLAHIERALADANHPLCPPFAFQNTIFLAPACGFDLLAEMLDRRRNLFRTFRMFAMTDENEAGTPMVPGIYPRSLLYFVSGVTEREANGEGAYDLPIAGMERYYERADIYDSHDVGAVREFIKADDSRAVWSVEDRGIGLASASTTHGGFDDDPHTLKSVVHMIRGGA